MSSSVAMIHQLLESQVGTYPDRTAVVHGPQRVSYAQLNAAANRFAAWCLDQGLTPGDRVALMMENSVAYIVAYYGALKAGGTVVPLSSTSKPDTVRALLDAVQPRLLIASHSCTRALRAAELNGVGVHVARIVGSTSGIDLPVATEVWDLDLKDLDTPNPELALDPHQPASIIFTSGSTGVPKGVILSHANIVANTRSICHSLSLTRDDVQMVVLPFHYVMGKSLLNTHIAVGGTVVLNNTFAFPATVLNEMEREGVTGLSGVPSTFAFLLHRSPLESFRERLPSLRYCSQAGGHMSAHIKHKLLSALPPQTRLYVMYGATEASARLTCLDPDRLEEKIESIGTPIQDVCVRVLDESGTELPSGEVGELVASGSNIMAGYWQDPTGTTKVLDENGYHTGDLGYRDEEGFLFVTGRRDHQLKVGGHRINPMEVEDAIFVTGLVQEVTVIGVPDGLQGHTLVALAVPAESDLSAEQLLRACSSQLPRHKLPAHIRFLKAIPKMASGKFDMDQCRALANEAN